MHAVIYSYRFMLTLEKLIHSQFCNLWIFCTGRTRKEIHKIPLKENLTV